MDLLLNKDDIELFPEELEPPRCASVLNDCQKSSEINVNKIYELSSTIKEAQIKSARQIEDVHKPNKFINEKFNEFEADRKEKGRRAVERKDDLKSLKEHLSKADKTVDCRKQYSRRNCCLAHGVEEENNEDTCQGIIDVL